jgi:hypothetical protein
MGLLQAFSETGDVREPDHNVSRRNRRCNNYIHINDKVKQNAPKLYHTYPPGDPAIPELADLLRRKRQARKDMHNFKSAADRRQYNFLKNCIHRRLKQSKIQRFEKDIEDASTTNNIWKITKRFTKSQTQHHTPVFHGRRLA